MRQRGQREMRGQRLAHVGEAAAPTEIARPRRCGPNHSIGTSSRVWSVPAQVGSQPWSAVISARSPRAQPRLEFRQTGIEGLERGRVAGHVAAMAVERVEVDEIGEDQRCRRAPPRLLRARRRTPPCCPWRRRRGDAAMGEDVGDLADRHDRRRPRRSSAVEQRVGVRRRGEVLAVGGADECRRRCRRRTAAR